MLLLLHMPPHQLSRRTALFRPNRNQRYLPPTRAIPLRTGKGESGLIPVTTNANSIHFGKWFAKGFFVPDELATSIGEQRHECLAELLNDDDPWHELIDYEHGGTISDPYLVPILNDTRKFLHSCPTRTQWRRFDAYVGVVKVCVCGAYFKGIRKQIKNYLMMHMEKHRAERSAAKKISNH